MEYIVDYVCQHWMISLFSVFLTWFCYSQIWKPYREFKKLNLPGPWFIPLLGNKDMIFGRSDFHLRVKNLFKQHGEIFGVSAFGLTVACIKDLEMLKEIMIKEFPKFNGERDQFILPPKEVCSQFLTATCGQHWSNQRRALSPAFSASRLKHILKLINDSCDILDTKLRVVADKDEPIDIFQWLSKFTLETILCSAFGVKSETQTTEDDYLAKLAKKAMNADTYILLLFSSSLGRWILSRMKDPLRVGELADIALNIINSRKDSSQNRKDLLQLMLDSRNESEGKRLEDIEIVAQSILFLLAGYETSSVTLGFLCHHLAVQQDIQDKIRQEIDENWTEDEEFPSYETIGKMSYLEMSIQETLRMYPPAHMTQRFIGEDCTVRGQNFFKGHQVIIPIYSIHHDPRYYPEPEKFDPLRFTAEKKAKRDSFVFMPFGNGPRNCIGMRFAMMEMKMVLVRMLKEFKLEVCSKTEIPMQPTSQNLLQPRGGVWVQIKSRKKSE